jgi:hypothetical protein
MVRRKRGSDTAGGAAFPKVLTVETGVPRVRYSAPTHEKASSRIPPAMKPVVFRGLTEGR